jgi:AraC-like DNA-binding protein
MTGLDAVLDGLAVEIDPFAVCEVRGDGRLNMGCQDKATLHFILAGAGTFKVAQGADMGVRDGHVILAPAALSHRLAAGTDAAADLPACRPLEGNWDLVRDGSGTQGVLAVCGRVRASYQEVDGLLDFLSAPILVDLRDDRQLRHSFEHLIEELAAPRAGTRAIARALMQQCLVLMLRAEAESDKGSLPWLAAAADQRLWAAVSRLLSEPRAPHTLESLAHDAAMSRSAFADHFARAFGRGPIDLLREVRLRHAARLLLTTDASVKSIARDVGYSSRSYFTRAFAHTFGTPPASYRAANSPAAADGRQTPKDG